jgi:hypothetical protein
MISGNRLYAERAASLAQQIIAQQIIEPSLPGFVGVAADVDAPGELHLTGFGILHVDIDVQDQVADLLHGAPRGPVRADPLRELALAAVAVADRGSRCDLLDRVRRNVDNLISCRFFRARFEGRENGFRGIIAQVPTPRLNQHQTVGRKTARTVATPRFARRIPYGWTCWSLGPLRSRAREQRSNERFLSPPLEESFGWFHEALVFETSLRSLSPLDAYKL